MASSFGALSHATQALFKSAKADEELAELIATAEHCVPASDLQPSHLANMYLGRFEGKALTYAKLLVVLRDGTPAVAEVAQVNNPGEAGYVAPVAAVAAVPGIGGLAGRQAESIVHELMRLQDKAAKYVAKEDVSAGALTADSLADALSGGKQREGAQAVRISMLPESKTQAFMDAGYASNLHKPEQARLRPGTRVVSQMAHWSCALPDAGARKPRFPSYKACPFDAVVSAEDTRVFDPAQPSTESLVAAFMATVAAWEACSLQAPAPAGFLGAAVGQKQLSADVAGYEALRKAGLKLDRLSWSALKPQLELLQDDLHGYSEAAVNGQIYSKAVDTMGSIPRFIASANTQSAAEVEKPTETAAAVPAAEEAETPAGGRKRERQPDDAKKIANLRKETEELRAKMAKHGILGKSARLPGKGKGGGGYGGGYGGGGYGGGGYGGSGYGDGGYGGGYGGGNGGGYGGGSGGGRNGWRPDEWASPDKGKGEGKGGKGGWPPAPPGDGRPLCRDFQRGLCNRGRDCRFAHTN